MRGSQGFGAAASADAVDEPVMIRTVPRVCVEGGRVLALKNSGEGLGGLGS